MRDIILASQSPRRREILTQVGIPFTVKVSNVEEIVPDAPPVEVVQELARQKAAAVAAEAWAAGQTDAIVLGADTIVVCDGEIMGKPADRQDAERMIRKLAGRDHEVYTGVAVASKEETFTFAECTLVTVREISEEDLQEYLSSVEPYDKAGSYAVQGLFAKHIEKLNGDYYNVVGLPVSRIYHELKTRQMI